MNNSTGGRDRKGRIDFGGDETGSRVRKPAAVRQMLNIVEVKGFVKTLPKRQQGAVKDCVRQPIGYEQRPQIHLLLR